MAVSASTARHSPEAICLEEARILHREFSILQQFYDAPCMPFSQGTQPSSINDLSRFDQLNGTELPSASDSWGPPSADGSPVLEACHSNTMPLLATRGTSERAR